MRHLITVVLLVLGLAALAFWLAVGTDTLMGVVVAQNARAIR